MFRSRHGTQGSETDQLWRQTDPRLRDEVDADPIVEEMVSRLRAELTHLAALDEWGRPVAWRNVVRVALGPELAQLRDARTSVRLAQAIEDQSPSPRPDPPVAEPDAERDAGGGHSLVGWPDGSTPAARTGS